MGVLQERILQLYLPKTFVHLCCAFSRLFHSPYTLTVKKKKTIIVPFMIRMDEDA